MLFVLIRIILACGLCDMAIGAEYSVKEEYLRALATWQPNLGNEILGWCHVISRLQPYQGIRLSGQEHHRQTILAIVLEGTEVIPTTYSISAHTPPTRQFS
jgi:hypothetical protein